MKIYPILNKPGKGKYVFIFILNERAVRARHTYSDNTSSCRSRHEEVLSEWERDRRGALSPRARRARHNGAGA